MEYQKVINLLDNKINQLSKYWPKIWVEINDDSRHNANIQIRFKNMMLKSSLCDYNDA